MKYFIFAVSTFLVLGLVSCDNLFKNKKMNTGTMNNNATPDGSNGDNMPEITFEEEDHDFGTIEQGEKIDFNIKFTNTGKSDLLINNCQSSCGCTVPNWPRDPIRPGQSGYIEVRFDSEDKRENVTKEVTISTNCNPAVRKIKFHGYVKVPQNKQP
jgi:hypothetical protein